MATEAKRKKRKITIALDEDVVQYFQMLGHKEERAYGPLMNKVLRGYVLEAQQIDREAAIKILDEGTELFVLATGPRPQLKERKP